jgi:hypothetical protein
MQVTWNELKNFASRNVSQIQYIELGDGYQVFVAHSGVLVECKIETGSSECTDFETNYKNASNSTIIPYRFPFSAKRFGQYGLFKRLTGIVATLEASTTTTVDFVVPYNNCKIDGVDLLWFPEGVTANFKVLDTPTGSISTVPNYMLNQFAIGCVVAKDFHQEKAQYDADLIKDLKLRFEFINSTSTTKTIGINLHLHEVK